MMNAKKNWQYYVIDKARMDYKGARFFRFNMECLDVCQVCLSAGEIRRGRSNNIGITMICRLSFFANYLAMGYAVPCEKKVFDKAFAICLKLIETPK